MPKPRDMLSRLINKVEINDETGCWDWIGSVFKKPYGDYGQIRMGGKDGKCKKAHRISYEHFVGKFEDNLELDHICHNTLCINPQHLEPVTHAENQRRRKDSRLPNCRHGHLYTQETTYIRPDNGRRECITCRRTRHTS